MCDITEARRREFGMLRAVAPARLMAAAMVHKTQAASKLATRQKQARTRPAVAGICVMLTDPTELAHDDPKTASRCVPFRCVAADFNACGAIVDRHSSSPAAKASGHILCESADGSRAPTRIISIEHRLRKCRVSCSHIEKHATHQIVLPVGLQRSRAST